MTATINPDSKAGFLTCDANSCSERSSTNYLNTPGIGWDYGWTEGPFGTHFCPEHEHATPEPEKAEIETGGGALDYRTYDSIRRTNEDNLFAYHCGWPRCDNTSEDFYIKYAKRPLHWVERSVRQPDGTSMVWWSCRKHAEATLCQQPNCGEVAVEHDVACADHVGNEPLVELFSLRVMMETSSDVPGAVIGRVKKMIAELEAEVAEA